MLEGKQLIKSYGELNVLKGIDIRIEKGEIVSIVGASGAGKSTLLHILGTLDDADAGELFIKGKNVTNLNNNQLARFRNLNVGFVFQFHNLLPEFTAMENICIPGYISKQDSKIVEDKTMQLMELLGIGEKKNNKPSELSGGEQQRASVARALINNPEIVFADEPSGNLDSKNAAELHDLFFKLREELNQTFVIVTHNEHLAQMADRILEIKDGLIVK
ncbi:MAG: ABC transporter ATP-binding protein [Cyclobacteriaceae bacterium]|nr:ABC transporter ATP-binding protein [Cyclobacteriaceae bacterium]MCK5371868.1 ABC transporter ATP-binding protein [Cyclobacteriaceae bacterium]MCK5468234.1 ABC transporter ATP-binding protein [Cyclobacteriaceae bacterium]MCK5700186.1 ABC transporter ATP-binding protein [Cyclobacteriaceae bacterium]